MTAIAMTYEEYDVNLNTHTDTIDVRHIVRPPVQSYN